MSQKKFHISGRVINRQFHIGIPSLRIEAWDKDLIFNDLVGNVVTDEQGNFQIEFTEVHFRECFLDRQPDLFFKIFNQNGELLGSTENSVLWNVEVGETKMTIAIDFPTPEEPKPDGEQPKPFIVKGQVRSEDGNLLVGVTIRAFDKDLRSEQLLGEKVSDRQGYYEIHYTAAQFCRAEKKSADLIVRAFNSQGTVIVTSPIIFNAQAVEVVDLMVGGGEYKGLSEYEKLMEELRSLLGAQQLADLREDTEENPQEGKFRDISFLSGETGINPELINFLVIAAKFGNQTDLHPAVFYGFFRQNLPTELSALLTQSQEIQRRVLETALHDNIIPAELKDRLEQILQRLQSLQIQQPEFLVKPEVLFSNLTDLSHLNEEEYDFITAKLNERLRREILNLASSVSEAMTNALQTAVTRINYQQVKDAELATVLKETVLPEIKKNKVLAEEAIQIESRLAQNPSGKVSDLLYLDVPLKENPLFDAEVRRGKTFAYTKLAGLNEEVAKNLVVKNISLDDLDDTVLADLVKDGILNDQQKNTLQVTADLGKLTGDNLPFVSTLKNRDMQSTANFIHWDLADWQQLITNENIALPPRETTATYAETILFNIEKTYPSQVLFGRLLNSQLTTQFNLLDSVNTLLRNNEKLIDGTNPASIDWRGVGAENREKLQAELQNLTTFANRYQHLGIADIINDKTVDLVQKKEIVNARLQSLDRFYKNNPNLDLRLVNFFDTQDSTLNWSNISTTDRPLVKKQLMAYQRSLNLAETVSDSQVLLSQGYDSAIAIASKPEAEFIKTSGLELGKTRLSYAKAQESTLAVSHNFETIRDAVWGRFKDIFVGNIDPGLVNDLREIDGFAELFGCQNYCDCEECKSILSPAAYFVDLMSFIEQHISKPVFISTNRTNHPLYLKNRRSDLWKLNLTCENTHTLIPYLTIVNEVLETYLNTVVSGDIFERLSHSSENISFGLPFNLPLEQLRIYLGHFGITLSEIYHTLKQTDAKIWRARLNLSQEEFAVITTPDLVGVKFRFGNPASFNDFDVQDFIRLAGISREQLDELRSLTFNPELKAVWVGNKSNPDDLQSCQEVMRNLTESRLDFIHRFIRIWKKTTWSIPELDLVLTSLKDANLITSDLNDAAIFSLAQLVDLQEKLKLTVEELCPMVNQLPVSKAFPIPPAKQGDRRLYERLFDLKKIFGEKDPNTHEINPTVTFHHYSLNTVNPSDKTIDPNTPLLLGGLGISETELLLLFDLLKNEMPFDANGDCTLDRSRISLLYRHARLARALKFSIEDFIQALRLNLALTNLVITTLEQIHQLVKFKDWLKSSPFKVSELCLILKGEESTTIKFKLDLSAVGILVQEVQAASEPNKITALKASLARTLNLTVDQLTNVLGWVNTDINSTGIQTALTTTFTNGVPNNPTDLNALLTLVREAERILLLFGNLKFKPETIAYLTQKSDVLGITNPKNLTINDLKALTFYKDPIALSDEAEPLVQDVLDNYLAASAFSIEDTAKLADLWKQDKSLIASLTNSLSLPTVAIAALQYLWECLNLCQTLGINGFSLQKLADDTDYTKLIAARDVALGAFSSKYDDEKVRKEKLEPYQDRINVKKRDALCDYIIARQKDLKFKDLHDIYAFFLLDVEMSGCFRTSRLVCAISSLQLYVHRCLINLEQSDLKLNPNIVDIQVNPALIPADEWDWRKNYRVWEANRKVFLYPENYIEPDLRDNKTPIFQELEDELLQQKITKESAEAAYKKYVSQFTELAHLKIAGSYYYEHENTKTKTKTKTYYFFGRTQQDPPQFYYRKWIDNKVWTVWEKIELAINSERVAAVIHLGKLYLFWVEIKTQEKSKIENGNNKVVSFNYSVVLNYSFLDENHRWHSPQKLDFTDWMYEASAFNKVSLEEFNTYCENSRAFKKIYAHVAANIIYVHYLEDRKQLHDNKEKRSERSARLNLFFNRLDKPGQRSSNAFSGAHVKLFKNSNAALALYWFNSSTVSEAEFHSVTNDPSGLKFLTNQFSIEEFQPEIALIQGKPGDYIVKISDQNYTVQYANFQLLFFSFKRVSFRTSTSLVDELGEILFTKGLKAFLSLETQKRKEHPVGISFTNPFELLAPFDNPNHVDFKGAYGEYYRELFFHIPFLIANHFNANQKFKEAKWWYERIFDPTASEPSNPAKPADRNWRYIEFRDVTLQKMKDTLTDQAAIEQYKQDPFNPHAIARLRLSAYQKAIVMKYIDNLLDWGDYLFAQDSMESINEATMLYVLAFDILGKRPAKLGQCETASDEKLTYENIGPGISKGSEFLITLENWSWSNSIAAVTSKMKTAIAVNAGLVSTTTSRSFPTNVEAVTRETVNPATTALSDRISMVELKPQYRVASYATAVQDKIRYVGAIKDWEVAPPIIKYPGFHFHIQTTPVFCVPPNYDLLKYWDRVEDRLFKIRNCMNISGVRRQLALFQPPIDPMALVRARAAGLSLEDILGMLNAPLPPYRFSYLIEKAKPYTQTVQSFGSALLSALEKKDVEELTLLRSVHERNILRMTKDIKKQQVREAQYQYQALVEAKANVQNRIDYYQGLIDAGLTGWEVTQQISRHTGTILKLAESIVHLQAGITYLFPQVGSPFAMKYGGKELGDSGVEFAQWTSSMAAIADAVSASAGLEATFQRREQEWKQQLLLVQEEYKQVEQQRLAADVRQLIAEKDLEIHEKNMEQADELHEFYKNKFTSLGLYNYLSTTLNRLYREAYNVAYDMAKMAERTYQFERDDDTIFIAGDNWHFDRAGLLAGERLLLQLQRMEKAYLEQHKRDYEVTQSFSLTLLNPSALVGLKQSGNCEFTIPEIMFDLFYPGQFKRLIKSVRITIPCVTGLYTNISAKLTLKESKVRKAATADPADLIDVPSQKLTSIATSNAQNDGGLFELNFRDERYLPFEGAGAISTWGLELPSKLRPFSYDTISDVIIHISYIAKDDGAFRTTVENQIADALTDYAASNGLYRLLSLKHEFPNAFYQLLHPSGTTQTTEFELSKQHFPYFLADRDLTLLSPVTVYLKPKDKDGIATTGLTLKVNNANVSSWNDFAENMKAGIVSLSGNPIKKWIIDAETNSIDKDKLDDILILLKYTA
ncbi:neuraminidase-like domain-containing protein [Microcoleus sp. N3A4]|uniref:Tc toxin subunit A-related protein n=1 Tax=Microcoleus sp. N3A4 TaxID=3055379 RepID=UPI002FCF409C